MRASRREKASDGRHSALSLGRPGTLPVSDSHLFHRAAGSPRASALRFSGTYPIAAAGAGRAKLCGLQVQRLD